MYFQIFDLVYFLFLVGVEISIFAKTKKMQGENSNESDFTKEDEKKFEQNGLRQYGVYSAVVFQMLATMGLAFWGGKKLNDYFEINNNLLTIGVGFLGMGLAFYNLLNQLKNIQNNENKK